MKTSLAKTFRLLELSRAQNQYGYVLAEIPKGEISDLAQHHYLVTAFAWQLARLMNKKGASLNIEKVLEICLVHDLGELFGGDIAMPYAKANPKAKEKASEFERENQKFLADFLQDDEKYLEGLFSEAMEPETNEALVAKIADFMEVTHYKLHIDRLTEKDVSMVTVRMYDFASKMKDTKTQKVAGEIIAEWEKEILLPKAELLDEYK